MTTAELLFDCRCGLGEGALWHPGRRELFWFDIEAHTLLAAGLADHVARRWTFPDAVTLAAIVDDARLLIAGASGLIVFDIDAGSHVPHLPIENDRPGNRSNDGRVHPSGTVWISTIGRQAEEGAGAIYAARKGRIVSLFRGLSIPNAICFSPDGARAYFTDTPTKVIMHCALDPATGLPSGAPEVFADTSAIPGAPDGAVVDSAGFVWNARYGGGRVVRFGPDGRLDAEIMVPTENVTCPAFAGSDLTLLVVTTAGRGGPAPAGGVFASTVSVPGQAEPRVVL